MILLPLISFFSKTKLKMSLINRKSSHLCSNMEASWWQFPTFLLISIRFPGCVLSEVWSNFVMISRFLFSNAIIKAVLLFSGTALTSTNESELSWHKVLSKRSTTWLWFFWMAKVKGEYRPWWLLSQNLEQPLCKNSLYQVRYWSSSSEFLKISRVNIIYAHT